MPDTADAPVADMTWDQVAPQYEADFPDVDPAYMRQRFEQMQEGRRQRNAAVQLLQTHAQSDQPQSWEALAPHFARRFPMVDTGTLAQAYTGLQSGARLQAAERQVAGQEESNVGFLARRVVPFASAAFNVVEGRMYEASRNRIASGQADDGDYMMVANYEQNQRANAQEGFAGHAASAIASLPAVVGEAIFTGGAGALGRQAATRVLGTRLPARAAAALTGGAAQVPFMPSMYAGQAVQENLAQNRGSLDPRGFGTHLALGAMQTAILGTLGKFGDNIPGYSLGAIVKRTGTRVGAGMLEQQAADVIGSAAGLQTGYGLVGDVVRRLQGENTDPMGNAALQMLTFAAFAGLHEAHGREPVQDAFLTASRFLKRQGLGPQGAAARLENVSTRLQDAVQRNPAMTRGEAMDLFTDLSGPLRSYGEALAGSLPERRPAIYQPRTPPEAVPEQQAGQIPLPEAQSPEAVPNAPPATPPAAPPSPPAVPQAQTPSQPPPAAPEPAKPASPGQAARDRVVALEAEHGRVSRQLADAITKEKAEKAAQKQKGGPKDAAKAAEKERYGLQKELKRVAKDLKSMRDAADLATAQEVAQNPPEGTLGPAATEEIFGQLREGEAPKPPEPPVSESTTQPSPQTKAPAEPPKPVEPATPGQKPPEVTPLAQMAREIRSKGRDPVGIEAEVRKSFNKGGIKAVNERYQGKSPASRYAREIGKILDAGGKTPSEIARERVDVTNATMEDAARTGGWTPQERYVMEEKVKNARTFADLANDPKVRKSNGEAYTDDGIREIMKRALKKSGVPDKTIDDIVNWQAKQDFLIDAAEKGKLTTPGELSQVDAHKAKRRDDALAKLEREARLLKKAFLKEATKQGITPERKEWYDREFSKLDRQIAAGYTGAEEQPGEGNQVRQQAVPPETVQAGQAPEAEFFGVKPEQRRLYQEGMTNTGQGWVGNMPQPAADPLYRPNAPAEAIPQSIKEAARQYVEAGDWWSVAKMFESMAGQSKSGKRYFDDATLNAFKESLGISSIPRGRPPRRGTPYEMQDAVAAFKLELELHLEKELNNAKQSGLIAPEDAAQIIQHGLELGEAQGRAEGQAGREPRSIEESEPADIGAGELSAEHYWPEDLSFAAPGTEEPTTNAPGIPTGGQPGAGIPANTGERPGTEPGERRTAGSGAGPVDIEQGPRVEAAASAGTGSAVLGEMAPMPSAEQRIAGGQIGGGQENAGREAPKTALAKAVEEREREAMGLVPRNVPPRQGNQESWNKARDILNADPMAAARLVDELNANPRAVADVVENALLLYRKIAMKNLTDTRSLQAIDGMRRRLPADQQVVLERLADEALDQFSRTLEAIQKSSSAAGTAFQFLGQQATMDYSLADMLRGAQVAKGNKPLSPEERAEIAGLHEQLSKMEDKLKEAQGAMKDGLDELAELRGIKRKYDALLQKIRSGQMTTQQKVWQNAATIWDTQRAIKTAFDLSAFLRQGGFFAASHPIESTKLLYRTISEMSTQHGYDRAMEWMRQQPDYNKAVESGIYFSQEGNPNQAEEGFVGRIFNKIPGLAWSNRMYSGFLNLLRLRMFQMQAASLGKSGQMTDAEARVMGHFTNIASGRGDLPGFEKSANGMARIFFAPRWVMSRFELLAGVPFYQGTARTRKYIAGEYARALAGLGLFYVISKMAGGDDVQIGFDPRSSDFGKVKIGNTRIDPLTGLSQATVLLSRLGGGQQASSTTGQVRSTTGQEGIGRVIGRFLRTKLAPIPGVAYDVLAREDINRQPITPVGVGQELVSPIAIKDVWDAMTKDEGVPRGMAASLLAILGMGTQVYGRNNRQPQVVEQVQPVPQPRPLAIPQGFAPPRPLRLPPSRLPAPTRRGVFQ